MSALIPPVWCEDESEHRGHVHLDEHFKPQRCPGICICRIPGYRTPHGLGEHK